jgi:hypothetical protein
MKHSKFLFAGIVLAGALLTMFIACTKDTTPPKPPVHDTVTITHRDTTQIIDTLYGTKPDSTVNLKKGLLLYLPFSGNIADSSGNNNPTTAIGNVLTYDAHGWANNAFGATGNGEKIYVTNNGSIKFDTAWALSLGFMVNVNKSQTYISMVDPTTGNGPSFNFGNTLAAYTQYLACGSGDISTDCGSPGVVNNYNITDSTTFTPVPGSWYNAIVQYHRGTIKIYINGILISTKTGQGTQALNCLNSKVVIGNWWDGYPVNNSMSLNGKLDNIRLYNRVLTPHEIVALASNYQVTSNSARPGLRTH